MVLGSLGKVHLGLVPYPGNIAMDENASPFPEKWPI